MGKKKEKKDGKSKLPKKLKNIDVNNFCLDDVFKTIKKYSEKLSKVEDKVSTDTGYTDSEILELLDKGTTSEEVHSEENKKEESPFLESADYKNGKYVININI